MTVTRTIWGIDRRYVRCEAFDHRGVSLGWVWYELVPSNTHLVEQPACKRSGSEHWWVIAFLLAALLLVIFGGCTSNTRVIKLDFAGHDWCREILLPKACTTFNDATFARGFVLFDQGKLLEALDSFEQLKGTELDADAHAMAGFVQAKMGNAWAAETELKQAVRSAPDWPWPRMILALVLAEGQHFEDAEQIALEATTVTNEKRAWDVLADVRSKARWHHAKQKNQRIATSVGLVAAALVVSMFLAAYVGEILEEAFAPQLRAARFRRELHQINALVTQATEIASAELIADLACTEAAEIVRQGVAAMTLHQQAARSDLIQQVVTHYLQRTKELEKLPMAEQETQRGRFESELRYIISSFLKLKGE